MQASNKAHAHSAVAVCVRSQGQIHCAQYSQPSTCHDKLLPMPEMPENYRAGCDALFPGSGTPFPFSLSSATFNAMGMKIL